MAAGVLASGTVPLALLAGIEETAEATEVIEATEAIEATGATGAIEGTETGIAGATVTIDTPPGEEIVATGMTGTRATGTMIDTTERREAAEEVARASGMTRTAKAAKEGTWKRTDATENETGAIEMKEEETEGIETTKATAKERTEEECRRPAIKHHRGNQEGSEGKTERNNRMQASPNGDEH